jgi:hypothetical protein
MRYYFAIIGTSAASLVVCIAVFLLVMALRPAPANAFIPGPCHYGHGVYGPCTPGTERLGPPSCVSRPINISPERWQLMCSAKAPKKRPRG